MCQNKLCSEVFIEWENLKPNPLFFFVKPFVFDFRDVDVLYYGAVEPSTPAINKEQSGR